MSQLQIETVPIGAFQRLLLRCSPLSSIVSECLKSLKSAQLFYELIDDSNLPAELQREIAGLGFWPHTKSTPMRNFFLQDREPYRIAVVFTQKDTSHSDADHTMRLLAMLQGRLLTSGRPMDSFIIMPHEFLSHRESDADDPGRPVILLVWSADQTPSEKLLGGNQPEPLPAEWKERARLMEQSWMNRAMQVNSTLASVDPIEENDTFDEADISPESVALPLLMEATTEALETPTQYFRGELQYIVRGTMNPEKQKGKLRHASDRMEVRLLRTNACEEQINEIIQPSDLSMSQFRKHLLDEAHSTGLFLKIRDSGRFSLLVLHTKPLIWRETTKTLAPLNGMGQIIEDGLGIIRDRIGKGDRLFLPLQEIGLDCRFEMEQLLASKHTNETNDKLDGLLDASGAGKTVVIGLN